MNYFKKVCIRKEKKKVINVLQDFSISNKSDIKFWTKFNYKISYNIAILKKKLVITLGYKLT